MKELKDPLRKSTQQWQQTIIDTLEQEQTAIPGRAGETPLSDLATIFSRTQTHSERKNITVAFWRLIASPDISMDAIEYWQGISFLLPYLPGQEKEILQSAFLARLANKELRKQKSSVYDLHGLMAVNGRLTIAELNCLTEIKKQAPIAWLGSVVLSGHFKLATKNTLALLQKNKLDLLSFVMGLDAWHEAWQPHEDFALVMKGFHDAIPTDNGKLRLSKWLERRGMSF